MVTQTPLGGSNPGFPASAAIGVVSSQLVTCQHTRVRSGESAFTRITRQPRVIFSEGTHPSYLCHLSHLTGFGLGGNADLSGISCLDDASSVNRID